MRLRAYKYIVIGLVSFISLKAQQIAVPTIDDVIQSADSLEVFDLQEFAKVVLANHPVVKQADLLPENGRQEIRLARGMFDPKLTANWDTKRYKDTEYYNIFNTTLKVPVWFPIDPKVSIDRNQGVFLDPENTIPESEDFRQLTAGVSLPIGRGLFIDARRAAVKNAELFLQISDAERIKMINKALLSAVKTYWDWYYAYYEFKLVDRSLAISDTIYRRVRQDFAFGELAAIDTVQAAITYQNRSTDRQGALINFKRASLQLSNFLWGENGEPLEIQDNVAPPWNVGFTMPEESLDSLLMFAMQNHPELQKLDLKIQQLTVSERLAKENLKPRVDLNYNFINSPINYNGEFVNPVFDNNYKFGLELEFPLFLRKERSKLKQTQLKIDQTNYESQFAAQQIINEVEGAYFEMFNGRQMVNLLNQAVNNYEILLQAEIFNLNIGESDLFKINFQQDKLLEAWIKLVKQQVMIEKSKAELFWAAGVPYLNFEQNN